MSLDGARRGRPEMMGLLLAILSALAFGVSGPFAKALFDEGWTPSAAVLVRIGGAALVLWCFVAVTRRGFWPILRAEKKPILLYGLLAVAGVQLTYFISMQYLPVGVALLLEYLAPLLVVMWAWLVRGDRPTGRTVAGGILALIGLGFVVEIWAVSDLRWMGLLWGLLSAVCKMCYFLVADREDSQVDSTLLTASGTAVGAIGVAVLGAVGVSPISFSGGSDAVMVAGTRLHWIIPVLILVLVSTVVAYFTGALAIPRLGASRSSLVSLSEVVFATLAAWVLLFETPNQFQILGGVFILAGIAISKSKGSTVTNSDNDEQGERLREGHDG